MNRRKIYLALAVIAGVTCCTPEEKKEPKKTAYDVDFQSILKPYCLLHNGIDSSSITDVNTLLFLKEGRWDTSFFIVLYKDTTSIKGTYQEITPRNEEISYKTGVVFHEGFSFDIYNDLQSKVNIDSLWNALISEAQPLLDTIYNKWDLHCCDGSRYLLSHESKFTVNKSSKNEDNLEKYAQFLRRKIIYPIYKRKKNFDKSPNPNN